MSSEQIYFNVFYGLQLSGLGGMVIILLTALLSPTIQRRHPIFLNFGVTWMLSCASYVLLIGHPVDYEPSHQLCFAQAVLIYTVPILTAGTTIALVIHVLITLKGILNASSTTSVNTHPDYLTPVLVLVPYLPAAGLATIAAVTGSNHPESISREEDVMYCNMKERTPGKVSAVSVAATMIGCFLLEVVICVDLYRHWDILRNHPRSKSMTIRVLLFTLFGVLAIAISMVFFFTDARAVQLNIVLAVVPVTAVIVFGTQRDMLESWEGGIRWLLCLPQKPRQQTRSRTYSGSTFRSAPTSRSITDAERGSNRYSYPPDFINLKDDSSSVVFHHGNAY